MFFTYVSSIAVKVCKVGKMPVVAGCERSKNGPDFAIT